MASHAPLLRNNTAPVFQHSTDGAARLANMSISSAPRASQLSGSTAFPSTTSLSSLAHASTISSINYNADTSGLNHCTARCFGTSIQC